MQLESIILQQFRNASYREHSFQDGVNVAVAPNASGKSNLLEAIYLLATGNSFRAKKIEQMVQWGQEVGRVKATIVHAREDEKDELEVVITTGTVLGQPAQKRKFLVNGTSKRKKDFIGKCAAVLFRPEDMDVIAGSPALRREYLNETLAQASPAYRTSLDMYEKALKRRNALLDALREHETTRAAFAYWDHLLIKHGEVLTTLREAFIQFINEQPFPMTFRIAYDPSRISEERLHKYAIQEVAAGYTLVGPHKDDVQVFLSNGDVVGDVGTEKELSAYGSRGEQRMAVIWLKCAALSYLSQTFDESPILLLDDVFSELDEKHQEMMGEVMQRQQTIMTTATEHDFSFLKNAPRMVSLT